MKTIVSDTALVAYCGLYCGACKRYLNDKCPGCRENESAAWCSVRACCMENELRSCAECSTFTAPKECKSFNNFMSKIFGLLFRSDRAACIGQIKRLGIEGHAKSMAELQLQSIKK